jgi:hypothetical protein
MTRPLSRVELREAERRWADVFAARYTTVTRRSASGKELSVFDRRYLDSFLEGASADLAYKDAPAHYMYALLDRGKAGFLVDCADGKPTLTSFEVHEQAVLFPPDCSWTAVVTEFGAPLFTYREWVGTQSNG